MGLGVSVGTIPSGPSGVRRAGSGCPQSYMYPSTCPLYDQTSSLTQTTTIIMLSSSRPPITHCRLSIDNCNITAASTSQLRLLLLNQHYAHNTTLCGVHYHSLLAGTSKGGLLKRFREIITYIYNSAYIYPAFVVAYKRCSRAVGGEAINADMLLQRRTKQIIREYEQRVEEQHRLVRAAALTESAAGRDTCPSPDYEGHAVGVDIPMSPWGNAYGCVSLGQS